MICSGRSCHPDETLEFQASRFAWFGGSYNINPALVLSAAYYHTKVDAGLAGFASDDGLAGSGGSPSTGQLPLASPRDRTGRWAFRWG